MPMTNNGLSKLTEEVGEMQQVIGKMLQYPALQTLENNPHPDGTNLRLRLAEEVADVLAAAHFVISKLQLDEPYISRRSNAKLSRFWLWDVGHDIEV